MKVLITDKINQIAGDILKDVAQVDFLETMPEDELAEKIKDYDALMIRSQTKVTAKILQNADKLKIVGRAGVGVDNVDLDAATQKGIIVVNSPDGNTTAAAEHTIALMLAMTRYIPEAHQSTISGKWERSKFTGNEVFNKTLGIIGLGKIGSRVAKAAIALGMKVLVCDPYASQEHIDELGAKRIKSLDEFWPLCDFITLHVPKTRETMYLINKNTLNRMKKGVRIINCARGALIDEEALKEAIESGQVAAAAIDVYENEPVKPECPLLHCNGHILLTPHLGASTKEAQLNVAIDVAEQIRDVLSGGSAKSAVNIPYLKADKLEPVKDYMLLAENIGKLIRQLADGATKNIAIIAKGALAELDITPLKTAVLKGVLSSSLEGVNYVNAPLIAKARNISIEDTKISGNCNYSGMIEVKLITDSDDVHTVAGAMIADNTPRIVKIDDYNMSISSSEHMLIIPHENKPAMIAQVATILGAANINISMMKVVDDKINPKEKSIMIINIDQPVGDDLIAKINEINGICSAKYIHI